MTEATLLNAAYQFEGFELDVAQFELRRSGHVLKLERIPMELLILLISRHGELVSRDEIIERIWGKDIFVETEHSVNTAVRKVRQTLGDDPENSRFIQTVVGKGYRFTAAVTNGEAGPEQKQEELKPSTAPRSRANGKLIGIGVVVLLLLLRLATWHSHRNIDSLAVLPFVNVNGNPDAEYLSDGLTEDLISSLSRLPDVTVRPRSSVFRYKGKEDADPQTVARDLSVAAVVTGRVTVRGDTLLVGVEMTDTRNNRNLWSEQYDRKLSDVLSVQHEIAGEISARLREQLTKREAKAQVQVARGGTSDPEAYQLYLKGRYYWEKRTPETLAKGRDYFNQAIARDPSFALAYVGLADYWFLMPDYADVPEREAAPKLRAAAQKALSLDDQLPQAHLALATADWINWEWAAAEREFRRALELDPNLSNAHHWFGNYLSFIGRCQEGIAHQQRAVELEPFSLIYSLNVTKGYVCQRMEDKVIEQANKASELDPNNPDIHEVLADAYVRLGRYDEAFEEWGKAAASSKNEDDAAALKALQRIYAKSGWPGVRRHEIQELLNQRAKGPYVDPADLAYKYAELGDKEHAFRWLDMALAERSRGTARIKWNPAFDPFRSDPRYHDLLRRMGLPE